MLKNIYKNKKTGKRVVTSETLSTEDYEVVSLIKGAKMEGSETHTKTSPKTTAKSKKTTKKVTKNDG